MKVQQMDSLWNSTIEKATPVLLKLSSKQKGKTLPTPSYKDR